MKTLNFCDVQMNNGEILEGEKIGKLTRFIINKFADEGLSVDEGKEVINAVTNVIGECSIIKKID